MKKFLCLFISFSLAMSGFITTNAQEVMEISSKTAILLDTQGNIIFEKNSHEKRAPASVTKIMTMLLVMESLESGKIKLQDMVTISANAAGQGGTQVYLEEGEQISVQDLLKSIAVSSANDAAMAIGEHISGTKEGFVELMNQRAKELSMNDTTFKNPTGLNEEGHLTSAYDIALMSVELLKHEEIYKYTTIWMDSIRNGGFELANTNKLLKQYDGLRGLKTGFTSEAMYCISAVAQKGEDEFIAVCMGAETSSLRSEDVTKMLNYAFANYKTYSPSIDEKLKDITVIGGESEFLQVEVKNNAKSILVPKDSEVTYEIIMDENITAPVTQGQKVGEVKFNIGKECIETFDIEAKSEVLEITFNTVLKKFIKCFLMKV